ncbi:MAG: UDP-3-O-acyl-N-acetylglucosamine deacetylase [Deltaproteobacteria bacterium]|nr:UDP-3-O-acyl-N-acetylglucosamine deacetylase [Candidatus Anaeroferrophillus wilburensis]MBN2888944.1 UDP-3-O-acyl-N-acetylglucosamine deacetylase [Deltaproteobacteria bacterium]
MLFQRTLKKEIYATGIGLHSGKKVTIVLQPAPVDHGILFVRVAGEQRILIEAVAEHVVATNYATSLGKDGVQIGTVEHLLAALYGMGVDNALIEVHGDEIPIMDGSASPFVFLIKTAGIVSQSAPKKFLVIRDNVTVTEGDKWISLEPAASLSISCLIDFAHPLIRKQAYTLDFTDRHFERQISRARTFGFLKEVEMLKAHNLAQGGSLENAVVLDDFGVMNEGGLRFPDEFVRHKVLDCLGDMSLLGIPLIARVTAHKAGHALNHQLVKAVWSQPEAWEIVTPLEGQPAAARVASPRQTVAVPQFA